MELLSQRVNYSESDNRVEIDIGENAGIQIFSGKDTSELIGKLAVAQFHATRKIRDLNRNVKRQAEVIQATLHLLAELQKCKLPPKIKEMLSTVALLDHFRSYCRP